MRRHFCAQSSCHNKFITTYSASLRNCLWRLFWVAHNEAENLSVAQYKLCVSRIRQTKWVQHTDIDKRPIIDQPELHIRNKRVHNQHHSFCKNIFIPWVYYMYTYIYIYIWWLPIAYCPSESLSTRPPSLHDLWEVATGHRKGNGYSNWE